MNRLEPPTSSEFDSGARDQLRQALVRSLPGRAVRPELETAVRAFARTARATNVPPEHVVIALKRILAEVLPPTPNPRVPAAFGAAVVTLCINEYYRAD